MRSVKLQLSVDPVRAAQKKSEWKAIIPKATLERLTESTLGLEDDVLVTLAFGKDIQGLNTVTGKASVTVQLACQRCGAPFSQHVDAEFIYSPVRENASVDNLPSAYEPIERDENGEINLYELIEDELMVSLPIIAMHKLEDCGVSEQEISFGEIEVEKRTNPFAVLDSLKSKK